MFMPSVTRTDGISIVGPPSDSSASGPEGDPSCQVRPEWILGRVATSKGLLLNNASRISAAFRARATSGSMTGFASVVAGGVYEAADATTDYLASEAIR